jgi:hypothetical protein
MKNTNTRRARIRAMLAAESYVARGEHAAAEAAFAALGITYLPAHVVAELSRQVRQ